MPKHHYLDEENFHLWVEAFTACAKNLQAVVKAQTDASLKKSAVAEIDKNVAHPRFVAAELGDAMRIVHELVKSSAQFDLVNAATALSFQTVINDMHALKKSFGQGSGLAAATQSKANGAIDKFLACSEELLDMAPAVRKGRK